MTIAGTDRRRRMMVLEVPSFHERRDNQSRSLLGMSQGPGGVEIVADIRQVSVEAVA